MGTKDSLAEFELLVMLAILRRGEDAYGTTIRDEIIDRTGRRVTRGALYSTLDRLEEKGFIRSWLGDPTPERGGRAKRYYRVEASGQLAVRNTVTAIDHMIGPTTAWEIRTIQ